MSKVGVYPFWLASADNWSIIFGGGIEFHHHNWSRWNRSGGWITLFSKVGLECFLLLFCTTNGFNIYLPTCVGRHYNLHCIQVKSEKINNICLQKEFFLPTVHSTMIDPRGRSKEAIISKYLWYKTKTFFVNAKTLIL